MTSRFEPKRSISPKKLKFWSGKNFDETLSKEERKKRKIDKKWLIGRVDDSYIAVYRPCTREVSGYTVCTGDQFRKYQAWAVYVGDKETNGSFENFCKTVSESKMVVNFTNKILNNKAVFSVQLNIDNIDIDKSWERSIL